MGVKVHASEMTHSIYPILKKLPDIVDGETPTFFVSPKDVIDILRSLETIDGDIEADLLENYLNGWISYSKYVDRSSFLDKDYHDSDGRLKSTEAFRPILDAVLDQNFPELKTFSGHSEFDFFLPYILKNDVLSVPFDFNVFDRGNTFSIVFLPFQEKLPVEYAKKFSGWSSHHFQGLVGTGKDWDAAVIFHEYYHGTHPPYFSSYLRIEVDADKGANASLRSGFNDQSLAGDYRFSVWPELAVQIQHLRAISSLVNHNDTHITNGPIYMPGDKISLSGSQEDFVEGQKNARKIILGYLAKQSVTEQDITDTVSLFIRCTPDINGNWRDPTLLPSDYELACAIHSDPSRLEELAPDLSEDFSTKLFSILDSTGYMNAGNVIKNKPAAAYAAVRELYASGAFDSNVYSRQYAFEFLRGVHAIAPGVVREAGFDVDESFDTPVAEHSAARASFRVSP